MRKAVEWTVYPAQEGFPARFHPTPKSKQITIQSDNRICAFDCETGEGVLSKSGRCYFPDLMAFRGAKPVIVPQEIIEMALAAQPQKGDHIGGNVYVG
jgi:hypothetical protein